MYTPKTVAPRDMFPSPYILLFFFVTICHARWYPAVPGLRGDVPPWGPALPPIPPPWSAPPPSNVFRRPMDTMVDLTNDLGVAILQDYSHVRSNFAFSPYGLASVLVVLYEGTMDESARQIHMAGKFPWDRDITRIGFRDIHRHLRSYFSHEGYLSGISMNKNKSSLKPDYKRVLRFYGYDVDVDPPPRSSTTTKRPMVQVPIVTSAPKLPAKTKKPPGSTTAEPAKASNIPLSGKESEDITQQAIIFNMPDNLVTEKIQQSKAPTAATPDVESVSATTSVSVESVTESSASPPSTTLPTSTSVPSKVSTSVPSKVSTSVPSELSTSTATSPSIVTTSTTAMTTEHTSSTTTTPATTLQPSEVTSVEMQQGIIDTGMLVPQSSLTPLFPTTTQDDDSNPTSPIPTVPEAVESRLGDMSLDSDVSGTTTTLDQESTTELSTTPSADVGRTDQFTTAAETNQYTAEATEYTTTEAEATGVPLGEDQKDIIKRSPDFGDDFRTLDEYFLGSDLARKALSTPLKDITLKTATDLYPRTLDEYMLKRAQQKEAMQKPQNIQVEKSSPLWNMKTLDEYFLGSDLSRRALLAPVRNITVQNTADLYPRTLDEFLLSTQETERRLSVPGPLASNGYATTSPIWNIKTLDEYLLGSDQSRHGQTPAVHRITLQRPTNLYPNTLDELLLLKDVPNTYAEQEPDSPIQYKTELAFRRFSTRRRKSRTITDMLHLPAVPDLSLQLQNGMFDSHVSRKSELYRPLPRQAFLVDAAADTPVPVMTYTNVFPYAYIPRLHSTALEFPLDDERYKLLLILPNERRGLRQLTYDLSEVTLRGVLEALRPTRVKATVPTFMVEGFVILTPALQRLGIWNVFDPRRANLSAMSSDPELYVRNVEQSVTVVIRNYVEILDIQTRTMAARSVEHEFTATHPFLYFVLDTQTNVALMAGQMLDPLNSRVY